MLQSRDNVFFCSTWKCELLSESGSLDELEYFWSLEFPFCGLKKTITVEIINYHVIINRISLQLHWQILTLRMNDPDKVKMAGYQCALVVIPIRNVIQ